EREDRRDALGGDALRVPLGLEPREQAPQRALAAEHAGDAAEERALPLTPRDLLLQCAAHALDEGALARVPLARHALELVLHLGELELAPVRRPRHPGVEVAPDRAGDEEQREREQ